MPKKLSFKKKFSAPQKKPQMSSESYLELSKSKKQLKNMTVGSEIMMSSDSDGETQVEISKGLLRKVSTQKQLKRKVCIKEGYLLKQTTSSFQRWRPRYFKLRPRRLFYAKHEDSEIFSELDLTDSSVAERSTKNVNCSFSIIGSFPTMILCAASRSEMDEWISALKAVQGGEFYSPHQVYMDNFTDGHNWYACTHNRPTYCNVCREVLSGVMNHGLSCDVCKFKVHKRCASKAPNSCKWATLATVGKSVIEDEDGLWIPHQWLEGNLPVSAKCVVCEKTCGSVLRLQDSRCLWCRSMVHASCKTQMPAKCSLGSCKLSIIPPTAIHTQDSDEFWQALPTPQCSSPLLVFVNSKSGDNQGVKFLRRFRQFLNPAQVFDLMCSGPQVGLKMFRKFETFRILICGGDGSIGWVLSEMDKLNLNNKAQVGVLPLGTGNDLAQVMGWGNVCDDDTQVPALIEKYEKSSTKLLDRWSILAYEGTIPISTGINMKIENTPEPIDQYEHTVADHLATILNSEKNAEILTSATVLCETVKDFVAKVASSGNDGEMAKKCRTLDEKLASLLSTLTIESKLAEEQLIKPPTLDEPSHSDHGATDDVDANEATSDVCTIVVTQPGQTEPTQAEKPTISMDAVEHDKPEKSTTRRKKSSGVFEERSQLMLRANSLKKAVRQIIEHTEEAVDEQNEQTRQKKLSVQYEEDDVDETAMTSSAIRTIEKVLTTVGTTTVTSPSSSQCVTSSLPVPSVRPTSRSAPNTPTSTLNGPMFNQYVRQQFMCEGNPSKPGIASFSASLPDKQGSKTQNSTIIHPLYTEQKRGSFLSRALLANADTICAPVTSPLATKESEAVLNSIMSEKCVMNSYFGIGLDAKITLDFHKKREEHPKKCSRAKNRMWYGVLATKEFAVKTYKNLEQRIKLECDGQPISLPTIQGIVVLNIPSFMGGANFWGSRSGNEIFMPPSYNDKMLEVLAVFNTVQLGMAVVGPEGVLQHHRIAQCRSIKITILGEEPVPLQIDGEAWLQPPGVVKILHKNRVQMLARDRRLEVALKAWEDKHRFGNEKNYSGSEFMSDADASLINEFVETVSTVAVCISESVTGSNLLSEELLPQVSAVLRANGKLRPMGRLADSTTHQMVVGFYDLVRELSAILSSLLSRKGEELGPEMLEKMLNWLEWIEIELKKMRDLRWLSRVTEDSRSSEATGLAKSSGNRQGGKFRLFKKAQKKEKCSPTDCNVTNWTSDDVGAWLESNQLHDYRELFARNDIQGKELLKLDTSDLKDLGISKMGHLKRLQAAIKELHH
uniref:diacylglycerol kinase delta isoform X2 n=1 Tax=Ciona intestinalis TaxID=7719 RepID=UPI00089DC25F|nr:diacylglycerol kinase delta isoform X2 [Ciona intestinalis]|eukprot:XP_018668628.1 diacylglycerol kinase delta isoform X2 [Ciona intestinalis]